MHKRMSKLHPSISRATLDRRIAVSVDRDLFIPMLPTIAVGTVLSVLSINFFDAIYSWMFIDDSGRQK